MTSRMKVSSHHTGVAFLCSLLSFSTLKPARITSNFFKPNETSKGGNAGRKAQYCVCGCRTCLVVSLIWSVNEGMPVENRPTQNCPKRLVNCKWHVLYSFSLQRLESGEPPLGWEPKHQDHWWVSDFSRGNKKRNFSNNWRNCTRLFLALLESSHGFCYRNLQNTVNTHV